MQQLFYHSSNNNNNRSMHLDSVNFSQSSSINWKFKFGFCCVYTLYCVLCILDYDLICMAYH